MSQGIKYQGLKAISLDTENRLLDMVAVAFHRGQVPFHFNNLLWAFKDLIEFLNFEWHFQYF